MALLAKIRSAGDPTSNGRVTSTANDLETDIMLHVERILSTRQGTSLTCPDFGLVNLSELQTDFTDSVALMQRSLKHVLSTYEPRLRNIQVRTTRMDFANQAIDFEVTGQIHHADGRRSGLQIALILDPSGRVQMRRE